MERKQITGFVITALFSALIAAGAFIRIPFYPVPITLQTLFALLAGTLPVPVALIADAVDQFAPLHAVADVLQRHLRDVGHRLAGEERLMRGHNYIRERQETCQNIIVDCRIGTVFEKVIRYFNLSADTVIYPNENLTNTTYQQIKRLLTRCDEGQLRVILATTEALLSESEMPSDSE